MPSSDTLVLPRIACAASIEGQVERHPSLLLGPDQPVGLFPVDEERLVEETYILQSGTPHEEAGTGRGVDDAGTAAVEIEHAKPLRALPGGKAPSEIERLRDEVERPGLSSTRLLGLSARGDEERRERCQPRIPPECCDDLVEVASDGADVGVQQEDELAVACCDALVHGRGIPSVSLVLDDGAARCDGYGLGPGSVARCVVYEDDMCLTTGELERRAHAAGDERAASVAHDDHVNGHRMVVRWSASSRWRTVARAKRPAMTTPEEELTM